MKLFNIRRGAIVALAFAAMFGAASPSYAKTEDLGSRTTKVDAGDQETAKEVVALSTPSKGAPAVTTKETIHYIHKGFWWWSADQLYTITTNGSAEYVDLLGSWMTRDVDGKLFRFNAGSTVGVETSKPTVDVGARSSVIAGNDSRSGFSVSAGALPEGGGNRLLNVTTRYTHADNYDNATYTVASTVSTTFVDMQNAYMAYVYGSLYSEDAAGGVKALAEKPTVDVGARSTPIGGGDGSVSSRPGITAGQVAFDGRSRSLIATRTYVHEEDFQRLRYTMSTTETATYVPEQNAFMAYIGSDLYRVRVGSSDVYILDSKPVVNIGAHFYKLDSSDPMVSVSIIPLSLTESNRSILVNVRRTYRHSETFQVKEYYGESTDIARYNDTYRVWTVIEDGRIYAVAFDGDYVNDGSVTVVHAPVGLHRPDVMVIRTPGSDDPPVVVPTKNRPPVVNNGGDDNDPPVVVPTKRRPPVINNGGDNDDPPVVVPSKRRPPVVINNDDDDGPAVVIPRK